ncbi:MAG: hypothetical protein ACE5HO_14835 [bacterium]
MPRRSIKKIQIRTNLRCEKIYPRENSKIKMMSDLKAIGITLNTEQAIELATSILVASQTSDVIDITGYRLKRRQSDGTYPLTVTII